MREPLAYGSDIPGARSDLRQISGALARIADRLVDDPAAGELRDLAWKIHNITTEKMVRRYTGRVAPVKNGLPESRQILKVRLLAKHKPMLQQQEIGIRCDLNAGRVSEILSGLIYVDPETGKVCRQTRKEKQ